jgi:hypothetical protein
MKARIGVNYGFYGFMARIFYVFVPLTRWDAQPGLTSTSTWLYQVTVQNQ